MKEEEYVEEHCSCNEEGCSCGSENCSCKKDNCCESEKSHSAMIIDLANSAWAELMKEKMKKAYEKTMGGKMDKIAALGVEANIDFWQGKMKEKAKWSEFEEKLNDAMKE